MYSIFGNLSLQASNESDNVVVDVDGDNLAKDRLEKRGPFVVILSTVERMGPIIELASSVVQSTSPRVHQYLVCSRYGLETKCCLGVVLLVTLFVGMKEQCPPMIGFS